MRRSPQRPFLVNFAQLGVSLSLGENAENIFEVLVGACVDWTSVSTSAKILKSSLLKHDFSNLTPKFDLNPDVFPIYIGATY